jgi:putative membrane protein
MFYMHSFGWGWWLVMSIGMVAFWALVIYGIVWLIRGGEISIEEYRRLLEALDDRSPTHSMAA